MSKRARAREREREEEEEEEEQESESANAKRLARVRALLSISNGAYVVRGNIYIYYVNGLALPRFHDLLLLADANIWYDERVLVIDPADGAIEHVINVGPILRSHGHIPCTGTAILLGETR